MALVNCPECGKENVSDSAVACPSCGFGIKEYYEMIKKEDEEKRLQEEKARIDAINKEKALAEAERQKQEAEKRKAEFNNRMAKAKPIILKLIIAAAVFVCVFTVAFVIYNIIGKKEYREAKECFNKGDYVAAIPMFESLGQYKDSQDYLAKCFQEQNKERAIKAIELLRSGDYKEAYNFFILLDEDDFEGTGISLDECLQECHKYFVEKGHSAYQEKHYKEALDFYQYSYAYDGVSYEDEYNACKSFASIIGDWYYFDSPAHYIQKRKSASPIGSITISEEGIIGSGKLPSNWCDINSINIDLLRQEIIINDKAFIQLPKQDEPVQLNYRFDGYSKNEFFKDKNYVNNSIEVAIETSKRINAGLNEARKEAEEKNKKVDPSVGMNAEQVLASTWGQPIEKNVTTYAWGTTEQWVYSNYRYIYFDNGRVTAISDH